MIPLCSIFFTILLLLGTLIFVSASRPNLRFSLQPADNDAIEGTKTLLSCYAEGLEDDMVISWMRDETRISQGEQLLNDQYNKRYKVEINTSGQMNTLYIKPVRMSDADHTFMCAVYKGDVQVLRSKSCTLKIKQVPSLQFPKCSTSRASYIEEKDKVTVTCTTEDVDPKPSIVLIYENTILEGTTEDNFNGNIMIRYTFTADREHDGKTFICTQKTPADKSDIRNCSAGPIAVKYKPAQVKIKGDVFYNVGKEALFVCSAEANPDPTLFLWSFDPPLAPDYYSIENEDRVLRIKIRSRYNGTRVKCEVSNSIGSSLKELQIFTHSYFSSPTIIAEKVGSGQNTRSGLSSSINSTTMLLIAGSTLMITALLIGILLCYFQICKIQRHHPITNSGYRIAQPEVYFVPKDSIAPSINNCDCNEWKRTVGIQVPTDLDIESVYMDIEDDKKTCSHKSV